MKKTFTHKGKTLRVVIAGTAMVVAVVFWTRGLLQSPIFHPGHKGEGRLISPSFRDNSPHMQQEKNLAESYWRRYRDVREDSHWGEKGAMGIQGPRDHYSKFGVREGRIFAPVIFAKDPAHEKQLAEAYWQRYPDVRKSAIWGEDSALQYLGPRDHYTYLGQYEGRIWGEDR